MTNYSFLVENPTTKAGRKVGRPGGKGLKNGNYWKHEIGEDEDSSTHDLPFMLITVSASDVLMDRKNNFGTGQNELHYPHPVSDAY